MTRAVALRPDQEDIIWRYYHQKMPQAEIAAEIGCSRQTVNAAIKRLRTRLNERRGPEMEQIRAEAVDELDVVKAECWTRLRGCESNSAAGVGLLAQIITARKEQSGLLGLEKVTVEHRGVHLARIEAILTSPVPILLPGAETSDE